MGVVVEYIASILQVFTAFFFPDTSRLQSRKSSPLMHILIIGGSYAGVSTAHRILKHASKNVALKVTLVSPNTDIYWNLAAPRALAGIEGEEKVFRPIAPGFKQYGDKFQFIVGTAQSLDVQAKTVELADGEVLGYDFLVLATGSQTKEVTPFKGFSSTEDTKRAFHAFREKVKGSKEILIAGGGPTGIEFAGYLKSEYGDKKQVHLIASGTALSEESIASVQKHALKGLTTLGVNIELNTRVTKAITTSTGQTEVTLSNGSNLIVDFYVPTYGLVPNSSYVPPEFINSKGFVIVDNYLRIQGTDDVWAIGDVSDAEWKQWIYMDKQSSYLAKNILLMLSNKAPVPYKVTPASKRILGFSMGPDNATGAFGSLKLPVFLLTWGRKGLYTHKVDGTVYGTLF